MNPKRFYQCTSPLLALPVACVLALMLMAGSALAQPSVTGVVATDVEEVEVTFDVDIDPTTGADVGNYQIWETALPANTVPVAAVSVIGDRAVLELGAELNTSLQYTLRSANVEPLGGGTGSALVDTVFEGDGGSGTVITPIADIHANIGAFDGQVVTVRAQVYLPTNYRSDLESGYIQDDSGRGINVFGTGSGVPALQDLGNIVEVTGTVTLFFTTVELEDITAVTVVSSGNAPLTAQTTTTAGANSAAFEGTYVEIAGDVTAVATNVGGATNYTVNDGSGPIVVRVHDTVGASSFNVGQTITARGAGSAFQSTFQILVGLTSDIFLGGGGPDTTPPTVSAAAAGTDTSVNVTFSEAIDATTGGVAGNYSVFETAAPGNTVSVASASVSGSSATLTLASALSDGTGYTVQVTGVEDIAGNAIAGSNSATFTYTVSTATPIADIHANTAAFEGQVVTVRGQVYIPTDYRSDLDSGYIQDSSGRGINIFGTGSGVPALQDLGNIVEVTGTVTLFFTTVEIADITSVTVISSGNTPLTAQTVTTSGASNSAFEGTYIGVSGNVSSVATNVGGATNYTVNDGSGPIIVRVHNTLGASSFNVGQTITARGAGSAFQTDFQILVGLTSDIFLGGGGPDTTPPTVTGAGAPSDTQVSVNFSEAVDTVTGGNAGNYSVFETATPANTFSVSSASASGSSATLNLGSALSEGVGYTVQVTSVEDLAGNAIAGSNSATFTYSASSATPIADIHANTAGFEGQVVTVRGQVYIPTNYRTDVDSGYIQDGSGRGINLFGNGSGVPALQDIGNIVEVTGTVALFFTTVEIEDITSVTVISSGNTPLAPQVVTTSGASNAAFEGTFIEVNGDITSVATNVGGATNYTVNDGSGAVLVRVHNTTGASSFSQGQTITARGAGSQFQSDFQILVGSPTDIFVDGGGPDTTPPTVASATGTAVRQIRVNFSEALAAAGAQNATNYSVFQTSTPANTIGVSAAAAAGSSVTLSLAADMTDGVGYTVQVSNVEDLAGNAIAGGNSATFTFSSSGVTPIAVIQANPQAFVDQEVTIEGQVYIPTLSRGTLPSGYIQDSSGRGINVFGSGAEGSAFQDLGTVVRMTGTITLFFTTVEIENISNVTVVSTGNPPLQPTPLLTTDASSSAYEGTYIRVNGTITAKATNVGGATNYTIVDDAGSITARVDDDLGATDYDVGETVWASGAGSQFQTTFQVTVGNVSDLTNVEPPDLSGPIVLQAFLETETRVVARFNEPVANSFGTEPANFSVSNGTDTVTASSASHSAGSAVVTVTLSSAVSLDDDWTLTILNAEDEDGNRTLSQSIELRAPPPTQASLDGPANTFLPREGEVYPITVVVPASLFDGESLQGEVQLRIFDLQGRRKLTLYDSRFDLSLNLRLAQDLEVTVEWDGYDEFSERVSAGAYVAHLAVVDRITGARTNAQMPVVVATRLDR